MKTATTKRSVPATMKQGDKVKTVYGKIEEVMVVEEARIITYESARELAWYHPTKVWPVR